MTASAVGGCQGASVMAARMASLLGLARAAGFPVAAPDAGARSAAGQAALAGGSAGGLALPFLQGEFWRVWPSEAWPAATKRRASLTKGASFIVQVLGRISLRPCIKALRRLAPTSGQSSAGFMVVLLPWAAEIASFRLSVWPLAITVAARLSSMIALFCCLCSSRGAARRTEPSLQWGAPAPESGWRDRSPSSRVKQREQHLGIRFPRPRRRCGHFIWS
jgi:hypothetical protein